MTRPSEITVNGVMLALSVLLLLASIANALGLFGHP